MPPASRQPYDELSRRVDELREDVKGGFDEIRALFLGLDTKYAGREATQIRLDALERSEQIRESGERDRLQEQASTRRLVLLAVFTAIIAPVVVTLLLAAVHVK